MLETTLNKLNEIIEQLAKRIKKLEAKNRNLRMDVKLWKNRTTEAAKAVEDFEELETELKQHRWIPADEPPDNIDLYKKVQVLEYESEIPTVMIMAEVFLDEGGEAEYWKPIILPEQALKGE